MLEIDAYYMLFTFILFLVLIFALNKLLYIPILLHLEQRNLDLTQKKKNIDALKQELFILEQKRLSIINDGRNKISLNRAEKTKILEQDFAQKVQALKSALNENYQAFLVQLKKDNDVFCGELEGKKNEIKVALERKFS